MRSLKFGLIIIAIIIIIIAIFITNSDRPIRIGIISNSSYCGERELGWRIKLAAESLGWQVVLDEKEGCKLRKIKGLDWVICLTPNNKRLYRNAPNYITIFHPFNYLDSQGTLVPFYEKYDGYLMTIKKPEKFENNFKSKHKQLFSVPFYPSLQYVDYQEVSLNNLMTMIPVWSNRLIDEKFKQLYKKLSQSGFTKFYGVHENRDIIEQGYMGTIPFDGSSVINILQRHGITLIFHSDIHNQEGIPSCRIFEAAAASTVIISDENAFIKEHFGDTVLYVNTSLSTEEIYLQIKNHMDWIQQHPQEAVIMAKKAHEIFTAHFLMNDQLLKINALNEKIKRQKTSIFF